MIFNETERIIALRYVKSRRAEGFISISAWFSLVGIMLGVATLIVVMSVMNGFKTDLTKKILGLNPHIVIQPNSFHINNNFISRNSKHPNTRPLFVWKVNHVEGVRKVFAGCSQGVRRVFVGCLLGLDPVCVENNPCGVVTLVPQTCPLVPLKNHQFHVFGTSCSFEQWIASVA